MNATLFNIFLKLLAVALGAMTPMLRQALNEALLDLYKKALKTDNPFDDTFLGLLLAMLGIPIPE